MLPGGGLERGLVLEREVSALAGDEPACHVGGLETERAAPCHRVDKGDIFCGGKLDGFENHAGGYCFLEGSVVHEPLVPALVQLFAREVEPESASVVDERYEQVLRGVAGCPRRGGSGCRVGRSEGDSSPFNHFPQMFCYGVAVVQARVLASDVDVYLRFFCLVVIPKHRRGKGIHALLGGYACLATQGFGMTRGWRYGMVQVQFPRDFGGLFLEVAEVFCLEVGDVHHDAVRDARVCDGLPGIGNFCGEFHFAVASDLRVVRGLRAAGVAYGCLNPEGIELPDERLLEPERDNRQEAVRLSYNLPLEPFFECAILSI